MDLCYQSQERKMAESRKKPIRLKPLSLHPLTPEQALSAFMRVNPKRILAAERRAAKKRGHEKS